MCYLHSSLRSMKVLEPIHPLVTRIKALLSTLHSRNVADVLPTYVGFRRNKLVDEAAKGASLKQVLDTRTKDS